MLTNVLRKERAWAKSAIGNHLLELCEQVVDPLLRLQPPPPDLVFHYTGVEGLTGIISTGSLWATHLSFMNDASELSYARELIDHHFNPAHLYADHDNIEGINLAEDDSYFAVCFCESGDLLSQWRGYADRGGGFAIGFRALPLLEHVLDKHHMMFRKIVYDRQAQDELLKSAVAHLSKARTRLLISQPKPEAIAAWEAFLRDVRAEFLIAYKSSHFAEEQEWRLMLRADPEQLKKADPSVCFRRWRGLPVPYVALRPYNVDSPHSHLPIVTVTTGPGLERQIATFSVQLLLEQHGHRGVTIWPSEVPIRI